ncbi:phospho-N-acetylmuramoyl-pentapeptide-transferase [Desulfohalobiaceae bacterium Ax17]|uniref:phospho-N-acetylmuramoyl-pentapeptide- transferase n=1 Tax=Desulfovulcanus ferrireducens TaxID=2831190 RepID=UPI00207BD001|nr:phospho-N-acetylmuramoyl-pentapeptide-transferase [Desulfovulcanus ferrireducens]MBT8762736.1 phospho-N-acetylmuramoyl-pentapeptide-transferase [Desulfovulcanus ferrireducens]
MLYHLLYPLSQDYTVFNVFRYITFRSIYALLTALLISIVLGPKFIEWLRKIKFGQYIQEDGPKHQNKAGTPTMGGLLIGASLLGSVFLWGDLTNKFLWLTIFVFLGFGLVGFVDDYLKIVKKQNKGLSAQTKFLGQTIVALGVVSILVNMPGYTTELLVPFFKDIRPDLYLFYIPFAIFVMVGASNAVNLTDGLDGLAIGPVVVCAACFALFVYVTGHSQLARYLQIAYIPGVGEVTVFCGAMVGAGLGFLWFNAYPAQIFMGDVGSLSLGGCLGFIAVLCKQELILVIVGGLFVVETISVILQVGYFKLSGGKRIFRMAPLHHHFELKGVPESKIIVRFWILSILLALVALSTLKLR